MGKALLIIVLGSGIVLAKQLYNSHEGSLRTAKDQRNYAETVLAREIATSAFNVGMGEIRAHGERLADGVTTLNGTNNAGRSGRITEGRHAGGMYTVRADMTSGHSVRVTATGYYGSYREGGVEKWRGRVVLHDEYRVQVLRVRERSLINVSFIESQAGYCSAVFYQAYTPSMAPGTVPPAIMLFAPDNRDRRTARPSREIIAEAGTQMNFFIGVDQNCSERPPAMTDCQARAYARDYNLNFGHYRADGTNSGSGRFDYLHYALDAQAGSLDQVQEAMWGFVEQHPATRNRWRIGWEDIHNTSWNLPTSSTPSNSLQATKRLGYDGLGWPTADVLGFRLLRDYGNRPDFSDQVIQITTTRVDTPEGQTRIAAERTALQACGHTVPPEFQAPPPPPPPPPPTDGGTTAPAPTPGGGTTTPSPTQGSASCPCQGNKKVYVLHRPPGNERNEQRICIGEPAWISAHSQQHNDEVICRGL